VRDLFDERAVEDRPLIRHKSTRQLTELLTSSFYAKSYYLGNPDEIAIATVAAQGKAK